MKLKKPNDWSMGVAISLFLHLGLVALLFFNVGAANKKKIVYKKGFGTLPVVVYSQQRGTELNKVPLKQIPKNLKAAKNFVEIFEKENPQKITPQNQGTGTVYYPSGIPSGSDSLYAKDPKDFNSEAAASVHEIMTDDEFVFSPFFSRLKENLYPIWARKVRRSIEDTDLRGATAAKTVMRIKVDELGDIKESVQIESSGCVECDEVAQESLLTLGKIINPPSSLKKEDGLYSFKLTFTIYTQYSSSLIQFEPLYPGAR